MARTSLIYTQGGIMKFETLEKHLRLIKKPYIEVLSIVHSSICPLTEDELGFRVGDFVSTSELIKHLAEFSECYSKIQLADTDCMINILVSSSYNINGLEENKYILTLN